MSIRDDWKAFLTGLRKSRTMMLAYALAALSAIQEQQEAVREFLRDHAGIVLAVVSVVIAILRIKTTQSITDRGSGKGN